MRWFVTHVTSGCAEGSVSTSAGHYGRTFSGRIGASIRQDGILASSFATRSGTSARLLRHPPPMTKMALDGICV